MPVSKKTYQAAVAERDEAIAARDKAAQSLERVSQQLDELTERVEALKPKRGQRGKVEKRAAG